MNWRGSSWMDNAACLKYRYLPSYLIKKKCFLVEWVNAVLFVQRCKHDTVINKAPSTTCTVSVISCLWAHRQWTRLCLVEPGFYIKKSRSPQALPPLRLISLSKGTAKHGVEWTNGETNPFALPCWQSMDGNS